MVQVASEECYFIWTFLSLFGFGFVGFFLRGGEGRRDCLSWFFTYLIRIHGKVYQYVYH